MHAKHWIVSSWIVALAAPAALAQGATDLRIEGDQRGASFGSALATADVNGDGFADLIVGAPGWDDRFRDEGRVSVHLGSAGGLAAVSSWTAYGRQPGAHFGTLVATGDVNGDGFQDVIVSAPDFDRHSEPANPFFVGGLGHARYSTDEGAFFVYHGSATGLTSAPRRVVMGIERGEHFGAAIAGALDVNGDGFDDVLVGASGKLDGHGAVFLFAGSPIGVPAFPAWLRIGANAGEGYGTVVGSASDLNGDGFDDFFAPIPEPTTLCGSTELFFGSPTGPSVTPSMSLAGITLSVIGPTANLDQAGPLETVFVDERCGGGSFVWRDLLGTARGNVSLGMAVQALTGGDWNGDGREDVFASTASFEYGPFRGRVWGYTSLPGSTFPTTTFPMFDGEQSDEGWGQALAMGDMDGDGADELVIGAPGYDGGELDEGRVVVIPGRVPHIVLAPSGPTIALPSDSAASGDFDHDGATDLLVSEGTAQAQTLEVRYGHRLTGLHASSDARLNRPSFPGFPSFQVVIHADDFNGDGFDDALIEMYASNTGLFSVRMLLYLGSAAGLGPDASQDLTGLGNFVLVGDVNGDGRGDVMTHEANSVDLHLGTSDGLSFQPSQTFAGRASAGGKSILSGNLDGDGFRDVLIARGGGTQVSILSGSPGGLVMQQEQTLLAYGETYKALVDVNGDGLDDLLLGYDVTRDRIFLRSAEGFTRAEQWWENPLVPELTNPYFEFPVLAVLDFDGDGRQDMLFRGHHLHRGSALGIERVPSWVGALSEPIPGLSPVMGDFDADGRKDLFVPVPQTDNWTVLEVRRP